MDKRRAAYRKYHLLYKTICLVTGKYYIGMHSTDELNDPYLGSGKILNYSLKKHGRAAHTRELLDRFPDRESLRLAEKEFVNHNVLSDPLCMNIIEGGRGCGPGPVDKRFGPMPEERRKKISEAKMGKKFTEEHKQKLSDKRKGRIPWNKGKELPRDMRRQISETLTGHVPWNKGLKGQTAWNKGIFKGDPRYRGR